MKEILTQFSQALQAADLSEATISGYARDARSFMAWFVQSTGEGFTLSIVTPSDIQAYRQYLQLNRRLKASSVNRKLAAISRLMHWAMEEKRIKEDPTKGIRLVPQQAQGPRYLSRQDQFALKRAAERDWQLAKMRYPKRWKTRRRDAAIFVVLENTGLRLNELTGLKLGDIHLSERKGHLLVHGKGNKERIVPLNNEARNAIQAWLRIRPESSSHLLWISVETADKSGISGRSVQRSITRLADQAGLDDVTPHMLRHTFAKNLVDKGVSLEKVAALLGHANLNTTRTYITPSQQDLALAVEEL